MKKLLILFVIVFVSLNSFSQISLTKDETLQLQQTQSYSEYVKFCNEHSITPKTETEWIFDASYLADYKLKQDIQNINNTLISSGTYLIKAKNQILYGFGCQALGGILLIGSYSATLSDGVSNATTFGSALMIASGGLTLTGLILEISSIVNIGKAGISLNEHGVGVRVNF